MREHGPELSLMTEIVYGQTRGKLFPDRSEQAFDRANKVANSAKHLRVIGGINRCNSTHYSPKKTISNQFSFTNQEGLPIV